jgi:hypothetical protein
MENAGRQVELEKAAFRKTKTPFGLGSDLGMFMDPDAYILRPDLCYDDVGFRPWTRAGLDTFQAFVLDVSSRSLL